METGDIRVYVHPNAEIRSYLTPESITRPRVEVFTPPLERDPERLTAELGTVGAQAVRELLALPGLAGIRIKPKEVRIQKLPQSAWEDLEPDILHILERALRKSRMRLVQR